MQRPRIAQPAPRSPGRRRRRSAQRQLSIQRLDERALLAADAAVEFLAAMGDDAAQWAPALLAINQSGAGNSAPHCQPPGAGHDSPGDDSPEGDLPGPDDEPSDELPGTQGDEQDDETAPGDDGPGVPDDGPSDTTPDESPPPGDGGTIDDVPADVEETPGWLSGQVSGVVFFDYNASGVRDPAEPGLPGRTVYLDASQDNLFDAGEPATASAENGAYVFADLEPGSALVRQQHRPDHGVIITSPGGGLHELELGSGAVVAGRDTGNVLISQVAPVDVAADRFPAAADARASAVQGIYRNTLSRDAEPAAAEHWAGRLAAGETPEQVARAIWHSAEHRGYQVDHYYSTLFERPADAAGRQWWVDEFLAGADEKQVLAGMLASDEYHRTHADNTAFAGGLFDDVLSRPADPAGTAHWTAALDEGATRSQVAAGFLQSAESDLRAVDGFYAVFLHRPGETQGRQYWLDALQTGRLQMDGLGAMFLGDPTFQEYFGAAGASRA